MLEDKSHQTAPLANDPRWSAPVPAPRSAWAKRQAKRTAQQESTDARRTRRLPINQTIA